MRTPPDTPLSPTHEPPPTPKQNPRLPAAAAVKTDSTTDLCQVGPFMCTPEGRLQKLMLGGAWLNCPAFPEALSAFEGLHTLEFQVATFGGDTFADAAKVGVICGEGPVFRARACAFGRGAPRSAAMRLQTPLRWAPLCASGPPPRLAPAATPRNHDGPAPLAPQTLPPRS